MDAADVLYGVCMGKGGVTKVDLAPLRGRGRAAGSRTRPRPPSSSRNLPLRWSGSELIRARRGRVGRRRGRRAVGGARARPGLLRAPARAPREEPRRRSRPSSARACSTSIDDETWERLEEALILADVGAQDHGRGRRAGSRREVEAGEAQRRRGDPRAAGRAARRGRRRREAPRSTSGAKPAVIMVVGRQRHRQDDDDRQARRRCCSERFGLRGDRRRGRHLPRGGDRAARDLGRARRRRDRARQPGRRPRRRRLRRDRGRGGARRRRGDRRHRRAPPHARAT